MSDNYYSRYLSSISEGIANTSYLLNSQTINAEEFFKKINEKLTNLRQGRNRIYFFGNGASAAFANHMALDFTKNGKIIARSLSDSALLTALSNDYSYDDAMVEFLKMERVTKDDLVITISSSGNSPNIVNVLQFCKESIIPALALSGLKSDNRSIPLASYSLYVPMKTYGIVECIHQVFLHLMLDELMDIKEWDREDHQNMNITNFKL